MLPSLPTSRTRVPKAKAAMFAGLVMNAAAPAALAQTYYIDPTAPGGGNGSMASPFDSWSDVSWHAGGTYLQKAGTQWNSGITVGASGNAANWITLGSYGSGSKPRIASHNQNGITVNDRSYVRIEDFDITVTGQERYWVTTGIYGVSSDLDRGSHIRIEDVVVGPTAAHGVYLRNKDDVVIRNSTFFNAGTKDFFDSADNIHLENSLDYLVERNVSYDSLQGSEYDASDGPGDTTRGTWRHNIAYDLNSTFETGGWGSFKMSGNSSSSVLLYGNVAYNSVRGPGFALQEDLNAVAINNTASGNAYGVQSTSTTNVLYNNIVTDSPLGLQIVDNKTPAVADNNIWHDFSSAMFRLDDGAANMSFADWQALGYDANGSTADPMFVNPANGDFRLLPGSPAINTGVNAGTLAQIVLGDGSVMPIQTADQALAGSGWEIGAYVFSEATKGPGSADRLSIDFRSPNADQGVPTEPGWYPFYIPEAVTEIRDSYAWDAVGSGRVSLTVSNDADATYFGRDRNAPEDSETLSLGEVYQTWFTTSSGAARISFDIEGLDPGADYDIHLYSYDALNVQADGSVGTSWYETTGGAFNLLGSVAYDTTAIADDLQNAVVARLTADAQGRIQLQPVGFGSRPFVNGIEILQVIPEPGVMSIWAFGLIAASRRRRAGPSRA